MSCVSSLGAGVAGRSGLAVVGTTTGDFLVQSTEIALQRRQQLENLRRRWERGDRPESAGGRLIISLALHDAVLDRHHVAAIGRNGQTWTDQMVVALEWILPNGWRDRRYLSSDSAACVKQNGGVRLGQPHWSDAAAYLRSDPTLAAPVIVSLFDAATAFWHHNLPGVLFCHCARLAPLQPLTSAAHARRASGLPLVSGPTDPRESLRSSIELGLQMARHASSRLECAHRIRSIFKKTALRSSDHQVRQQWIAGLIALFDEACAHGRAQALVVAGTLHVVNEGGIRGGLLKPRSLAAYVGDTVERLLKSMLAHGGDPDGYTAAVWRQIYVATVEQANASARPKVAAFLLAFHRMLLGRGAEPLTLSFARPEHLEPPNARIIFDVEIERALAYIRRPEVAQRIGLQAELMLLIGKVVAIRTSEVFTLRLEDVIEGSGGVCVLSVAPRRTDGTSKSPSVRRQVEIHDLEVNSRLLTFWRRRAGEDASPADFLFGEPRSPGTRFAERDTTELVQQAIKSATGDQTASFYCLRHRVLSEQAQAVLLPDARTCDEPWLLSSIAGRAGHASIASSRPYLNCFEAALQAWAMRSREAAAVASTAGFERVDQGHVVAVGSSRLAADEEPGEDSECVAALSVDVVIGVLDDVSHDHSVSAAALRNDIRETLVNEILMATFDVLAALGLGPAVSSKHRLLDSICLVQSLKPWWRASGQPKYQGVRRRLAEVVRRDPRLLERLTRSWHSAYRKEELSLDRFEAAAPLLTFLQSCEVPVGRLLITCAKVPVPTHLQQRQGRGLIVRPVPPRAGRASTRLHLCSIDATAKVPAGPAIAVQGLHAWMVAATVCLSLGSAA